MFENYLPTSANKEVLICPYCGEEQQCHEPDEISAYICYTECEHCEKHFWYSVKVTREYNSFKNEKF